MVKRTLYPKCLFWPFHQNLYSQLNSSVLGWNVNPLRHCDSQCCSLVSNPNMPVCSCSSPLIDDPTIWHPIFVSGSGLLNSLTDGHYLMYFSFLQHKGEDAFSMQVIHSLPLQGGKELSCRLPYLDINIGVLPSQALSCNLLYFSTSLSIPLILRFPPTQVLSAGIPANILERKSFFLLFYSCGLERKCCHWKCTGSSCQGLWKTISNPLET